jgi:hypothetical protein
MARFKDIVIGVRGHVDDKEWAYRHIVSGIDVACSETFSDKYAEQIIDEICDKVRLKLQDDFKAKIGVMRGEYFRYRCKYYTNPFASEFPPE